MGDRQGGSSEHPEPPLDPPLDGYSTKMHNIDVGWGD